MFKFKQNNDIEKRKTESQKILNKYKDRIPAIIEVNESNITELMLDKNKYLIPYDLTVGQFLNVIRKRSKINSEKALFLFFNDTLPCVSDTMGNVYKNNKDIDGFLYGTVSLENTFG